MNGKRDVLLAMRENEERTRGARNKNGLYTARIHERKKQQTVRVRFKDYA
jgi:hypothetical protein